MDRMAASIGVVIFLLATAGMALVAKGEDSKEGKALYEQHCALCHGADGKGKGPAAASLNPHPADFNAPQFWRGEDDRKIAETIRKGHAQMPAFKMSTSEIDDIIDYMKKAFRKQA